MTPRRPTRPRASPSSNRNPAGPRRALLQVPFGRRREVEGEPAARLQGEDPGRRRPRPGRRARRPRREPLARRRLPLRPGPRDAPQQGAPRGNGDRRHQDVDPDGGRGPSRDQGDRRAPPARRHRSRSPVLGLPEARRPRTPGHEDPAWARRDLDHFILAKLDAAGLAPSADAEPATLLRRLHFDLVGLPPSPEAIDRFLGRVEADGLDAALEPEVDALLASQHFGERWGRHWLDVARFAESSGKEANISFPYAWRYRDYVIDAMNADMPFDRFLVEQIAGDLLPYDGDAERARLLIATGFLAVGPKNLDESNRPVRGRRRRRADRRPDARRDGQLGGLRPLPRPQVRPVLDGRLLRAGRRVRQHEDLLRHLHLAGQPGRRRPAGPAARGRPADLARVDHSGTRRRPEGGARGAQEGEGHHASGRVRVFWKSGGIEGQLEKVDESGGPSPWPWA